MSLKLSADCFGEPPRVDLGLGWHSQSADADLNLCFFPLCTSNLITDITVEEKASSPASPDTEDGLCNKRAQQLFSLRLKPSFIFDCLHAMGARGFHKPAFHILVVCLVVIFWPYIGVYFSITTWCFVSFSICNHHNEMCAIVHPSWLKICMLALKCEVQKVQ